MTPRRGVVPRPGTDGAARGAVESPSSSTGTTCDRPALLIFDLDGTLYRTESSFVPTMRCVYAESGVPYPSDAAILAHVGETFPDIVRWLRLQGFSESCPKLADRIARRELRAIAERGELYPGALETLRTLRSRGHPLTVCTNGDRRYADAVLSAGGAAGLFERLQTLDDDNRTKRVMVAELRDAWPGRAAVVIGDRHHDIDAGRANGCFVIGAAYGYGRPEELETANGTIGAISELLDVIPAGIPGQPTAPG